MDYGNILRRSWDITWNHKFMIVLGFLASLGSCSSSSNNGSGTNYQFSEGDRPFFVDPEVAEQAAAFLAAAGIIILGMVCLFMILGIVFWLLRLTAEAGMIDAASRLDAGQKVSFGEAFSAGWQKLWQMIGLNIVLFGVFFLLILIMALSLGFGVAGMVGAASAGVETDIGGIMGGLGAGVTALICCLACVLFLVAILVSILYPFAQRAIVLEGKGVFASLSRGWQVIRENLGEVIILLILFFLLGLAIGAVILVIFIPLAAISFAPTAIRMFTEGSFEVMDIGLALGGLICMGLIGAAIRAIMTSFRSAAFTLAYQEFTDKELPTTTA